MSRKQLRWTQAVVALVVVAVGLATMARKTEVPAAAERVALSEVPELTARVDRVRDGVTRDRAAFAQRAVLGPGKDAALAQDLEARVQQIETLVQDPNLATWAPLMARLQDRSEALDADSVQLLRGDPEAVDPVVLQGHLRDLELGLSELAGRLSEASEADAEEAHPMWMGMLHSLVAVFVIVAGLVLVGIYLARGKEPPDALWKLINLAAGFLLGASASSGIG